MQPQLFNILNILKKYLSKYDWLCRPLFFFSFYAVWVLGFQLLSLTLIAYFTISPSTHYQDINDAFSSNEVSLMGLSSLLFVGLTYWLNPLTKTRVSDFISKDSIENKFLPGFIKGAL